MQIAEVVSKDGNGEGLFIPMPDDISSGTVDVKMVSKLESSEEYVSSARAGEMGEYVICGRGWPDFLILAASEESRKMLLEE